jgi:hypothetical protein
MALAPKISLGLGVLCLVIAIVNLVRGEIPWVGALAALLLFDSYRRERRDSRSGTMSRRRWR